MGILQSTKMLSFCVVIETGSTNRNKRAGELWGDICILSVHSHSTTNKEIEAQEKEKIVRDSRSIDPEFGPVAVQSSLCSSQSSSLKSEQVGGRERKSEEL